MVHVEEKLQLAKDLGLNIQITYVENVIKTKEIQKVIDGEVCRKINNKDLEDLFGITEHNKRYHRSMLISGLITGTIIASVFVITIIMACLAKTKDTSLLWSMPNVFWVFAGPALYFLLNLFIAKKMKITINEELNLRWTDIVQSDIEIPYGALLKIKELQEKKLCTSYRVYTPGIHQLSDPAIVGVIGDDLYLIYAWDMDKDIEKLSFGGK